MKKTFKCSNGHKFKSDQEKPLCPQCSEAATAIQWKKVDTFEANKDGNSSDRKIIGAALGIVTVGLFAGLSGPSTRSGDESIDEFKGGDGKFGGGGASGSF